ncbi:MAG: conjugal transfer protein TraN [Pseudomonadota bacterium]
MASPVQQAAAADQCAVIGHTCTSGAEARIVDGFSYTPSSCWNRTALLNCERQPPFDSCSPLEAAPSCVELSTECVDIREGACAKYEKRFSCQNADVDETELTIIVSSYTITRDETVSQCEPLDVEDNCVFQGEVCSEGPETRIINGLPVTKQCWAWEKTYSCAAETETSDCAELEGDQSCVPLDEVCLNELPDGTCGHRERNFKCGGTPALFDPQGGDPSCGAVEVCVGGDCRTYEDEPNKDFAKAASYLNMLDAIAKDFEDFEIFTGEDQRCRKWPLGLLNCCSDSGIILDVLNICNETERKLRDAHHAEVTHYVGTYCSAKALFVCLEKKRVHCTFNSKFGRIVHEQGRPQLGIEWRHNGEADDPICRGLTPEEIEAIDFEEIDLSELYDDMIQKFEVPDVGALADRIQEDVSSFTEGGIRPDPDGDDVEGPGGEVAEIDYDRRTRQCASGEDGEIVEERKVAVDPYGAREPLEDWKVVANLCFPIQIAEREWTCPLDYEGYRIHQRPYVVDDEGVLTYLGPWETVEDHCYKFEVKERTRNCVPPRQGSFVEERTIKIWSGRANEVGPFERVSGGCFTEETETRPLSCPATFTGTRTEERTYRLWEDGSKTDYSSWLLISDECVKRESETRPATCSAGWSGSKTETRYFDIRPDGTRENYSAWEVTENACFQTRSENRTVACTSGYSGTHAQSRTYRDNEVGPHSHYTAWATTSNSCTRSGFDSRTVSCPHSAWTHGNIGQRRNWTQAQGASKVFSGGWYNHADSCRHTVWRYRNVACSFGQTGHIVQRRQVWFYRDGRPDVPITGWALHQNNCSSIL